MNWIFTFSSIFLCQPFEIHSTGLAGSCSNLGGNRRIQSGCVFTARLGKGLFLSVLVNFEFCLSYALKFVLLIELAYSSIKSDLYILQEKPTDPDVFRLLGEVKYELKDYEGSAAAYRVSSMVVFSHIYRTCHAIHCVFILLLLDLNGFTQDTSLNLFYFSVQNVS